MTSWLIWVVYSHADDVLITGYSNLIRIKAVQKCILNETDLESALADQLSLYIGLNSEINIIKSLEVDLNYNSI